MKPNSPKGLERIIPSGMQAARATRPDGFGWADTLNTLDAHRLIKWADDIGKAAEAEQRLMDLYFTEGADLTNRAVLL